MLVTMEVLKRCPDITTFIENVAKEQGIEKYTITSASTNKKGEGYLGQIFTVTLQDMLSGEQLKLIIKAAFTDEKVRAFVPIKKSFLNEIHFYAEIEPTLRKISKDGNQFFPKCYKTLKEDNREMLCLEDLTTLNYEIFDKTQVLDDEHFSLIFKTYGRLHGYTFILKHQHKEEYSRLSTNIHNIFDAFVTNPHGNYKDYLKDLYSISENALLREQDRKIVKKFQKYSGDGIVDCFHNIVKEVSDYSTILHGDCWSNNLFFKYESVEGGRKLVDMRLIDFQFVKIGSPVCDLSYCLYSGGSKSNFDNLDKYLEIYHKSFSSTVRECGREPEEIFPLRALKDDWKKYCKFGMVMAFAILKVKTTKSEDVLDLTDNLDATINLDKIKFDEVEYQRRVREVLCHLDEIDAL